MDCNCLWSMLQECREVEKAFLLYPLVKVSDIIGVQTTEIKIWLDREDSHRQFSIPSPKVKNFGSEVFALGLNDQIGISNAVTT